MEIRCSQCGHVGPAGSVRPGPNGIELICTECGHPNILEVEPEAAPAPAPTPAARVAPKPAPSPPPEERLDPALLARLIPEPGDGLRCRKCAHLLDPQDDNCARCGLGILDGQRFAPGQAPWESAPKGMRASWEQAELLWQAAAEDFSEERVERFIDLVLEKEFHELAIRKLRFWLAEHPDDPLALKHLKRVAARMQGRVVVAQAAAETSAQAFTEGVTRARTALIGVTAVFWIGILLLFFGLFFERC